MEQNLNTDSSKKQKLMRGDSITHSQDYFLNNNCCKSKKKFKKVDKADIFFFTALNKNRSQAKQKHYKVSRVPYNVYLEIVRQLCSPSVPWVHGDKN